MARREAEGNHVFLAVTAILPQLPYTLAEIPEEFLGVWHAFFYLEHEQKHHEQISWYYGIIRKPEGKQQ